MNVKTYLTFAFLYRQFMRGVEEIMQKRNWLTDKLTGVKIDIDEIQAINPQIANEAVLVCGTWIEVSKQFIDDLEDAMAE